MREKKRSNPFYKKSLTREKKKQKIQYAFDLMSMLRKELAFVCVNDSPIGWHSWRVEYCIYYVENEEIEIQMMSQKCLKPQKKFFFSADLLL